MEKTFIVANWKMNLGVRESMELAGSICEASPLWAKTSVEVGICPSPLCLLAVTEHIHHSDVLRIGAQNVHWDAPSAQTGESSIEQVREVGGSFTLIGHSERRHGLGESQELVDRRCLGVLRRGFQVLLCIGETLEEREAGKTTEVLQKQLQDVLQNCPIEARFLLDIAYEPVWAIGTGKVATREEIQSAHDFIQGLFAGASWKQVPRILYGGSVKPDNFESIISIPSVQGALVGGASLQAASFVKLIETARKAQDLCSA